MRRTTGVPGRIRWLSGLLAVAAITPFALVLTTPIATAPQAAASVTPPPTTYPSGNACLVYEVPPNINQVTIDAVGGAGFPGEGSGSPGGKGGDVSGQFNVESGQKLYVVVGTDGGGSGHENVGSGGAANFGGGGGSSIKEIGGFTSVSYGGGGGGASFVSTDGAQCNGTGASVNTSDVLLVAGGGGGGGTEDSLGNSGGAGGNAGQVGSDSEQDCFLECTGGGNAGGAGVSNGGGGGGFDFGGSGGSLGDAPAATSSGYEYTVGGSVAVSTVFGGGGGGGWYGGGQGGQNAETYGGGGGGSDYTAPHAADVTTTLAASTGTPPSVTITPVNSRRLLISKLGAGSGTVTSGDNPQTINCGATCAAYYTPGTSVTLTAAASPGSRFAGWTGGACSGTSATCTVSLSDAQHVFATFNVIWQVQINDNYVSGGGGTVTSTPAGFPCGAGCTAFDAGTPVTLTAHPNSSSLFQGWQTGGFFPSCDGSTNPCSFTPTDRNLIIGADFAGNVLTLTKDGSGNGTITSNDTPPTIDCTDSCTGASHLYGWGQVVTLTAAPDPGSSFEWETYPCVATSLTCTLTMQGDQSIDGRFFKTPETLTVATLGSGPGNVVSSPAGINCQGTCTLANAAPTSAEFDQGTQVTLMATGQTGDPGMDSGFTGWGGACAAFGSTPTCTVSMNAAESVTATFTLLPRYLLTVSPLGNGGGTVTSGDTPQSMGCPEFHICQATYDQGASVTLTATPDAHSVFSGWSGACTNTSGTCNVTMSQAMTVNPIFTLAQIPLTITLSGTGSGTVTSGDAPQTINCGAGVTDPTCSADYYYGTTVVLSAAQASSPLTSFDGWINTPCTNTQPSPICDVTVSTATTADVQFTSQVETLSASASGGSGTGVVTSNIAGNDGHTINCPNACSDSYNLGSQVTLVATPDAGSLFSGWSGCPDPHATVSPATGSCLLTLDQLGQTASVTADFTPNEMTVTTLGSGSGTVTSGDTPQTIDCGSTCIGAFTVGTSVALTASPHAGSSFSEWGGACATAGTSPTCTITMNGASSVTATFTPAVPNPVLTVALTGPGSSADLVQSSDGGIGCGENGLATACSVSDPSGTHIQLTASGSSENATSFSEWTSGPCAGSSNPTCSFSLNASVTATAAFTQSTNSLTVATTGAGGGTVTSPETPPLINCPGVCSASYPSVTAPVALTETPNPGSVFNGWSGNCSGSTTCSVSMTQARSVTADFEPIPTYALAISSGGTGRGTVTSTDGNIDCAINPRTTPAASACSFDYPAGTFVGLNETTDNSTFNGWNGSLGCIPSFELPSGLPQAIVQSQCVVQSSRAQTVQASFTLNTTPIVVTMHDSASATAPTGTITSFPGGIDCPPGANLSNAPSYAPGQAPCGASVETGSTVTLTAVPQSNAALASNPFSGDNCTDSQADQNAGFCTVVVDGSTNSYNVEFVAGPTNLNLTLAGTGSGTVSFNSPSGASCSANCTVEEPYNPGGFGSGFVTMTASPGANSTFVQWSGSGVGSPLCASATTTPCAIPTGTSDMNVTATFNAVPQTLTVDLGGSPLGDGTVTSQPAGVDCATLATTQCQQSFPNGSVVDLLATPNSATSSFTGWSGACTNTAPVCAVTMNADTEVQANFVLNTQTLTVDTTGLGTGNVTSTAPSAGLISCGSSGPSCSTAVYNGTSITLTATPDNGDVFGGWSGACTNPTGSCTVAMNADETVTADFDAPPLPLTVTTAGAGMGSVTSSDSPPSIDCPGTCSADFAPNAQVTLIAAPDPTSSSFGGWSGDCSGTQLDCTVTLSQARSVTATFSLLPRRLIVGTAGGTGTGTVTSGDNPPSIDCGTSCSANFPNGTMVDLTATADPSNEFAGWTGACTNPTGDCLVTMNQSLTVGAIFNKIPNWSLQVGVGGSGTGTVTSSAVGIACPGTCEANVQSGTQVTLTASPNTTTSSFAGWSGACPGTDATTCTFTVNQAMVVTATFTLLPVQLTVASSGSGSGTITSSPAGISCPGTCSTSFPYGRMVSLIPMADAGSSTFSGWSGACSGTGACVVGLTQATSVTATFTLLQRQLTVVPAGPGTGTVTDGSGAIHCGTTCVASYPNATIVTLTATPAATSSFAGWSGPCSGSTPTCQVTMTAALWVTANFAAKTTTTVSSSVTSPVYGQPVTFTATVASVATGTPTGTVIFTVNGVAHPVVALTAGTASYGPTSSLVLGANTVSVSYTPADSTFVASTSTPKTVTVTKASSAVTLTQSPNPAMNGTLVTITATVAAVAPGTGTPTGTIQFRTGKSNVGSPVRLVNGVATLSVSKLTGNQSYTATYSGDGNFSASAATIMVVVKSKSGK